MRACASRCVSGVFELCDCSIGCVFAHQSAMENLLSTGNASSAGDAELLYGGAGNMTMTANLTVTDVVRNVTNTPALEFWK